MALYHRPYNNGCQAAPFEKAMSHLRLDLLLSSCSTISRARAAPSRVLAHVARPAYRSEFCRMSHYGQMTYFSDITYSTAVYTAQRTPPVGDHLIISRARVPAILRTKKHDLD